MATTEPTPVPDWIYPGAEVAEYTHGIAGGSYRRVEIAKVLKLHVVTTRGEKYSRTDLRPIGNRDMWSTARLVPLTDPDIAEIDARSARYRTEAAAEKLLNEWRQSGDPETLRQVIAALSAHLPADA